MNVGSTGTLVASVGTDTATNKNIVWSSSNYDICYVDGNGNLSANSVGNAVITATAADGSGVSASCIVKVVDPVIGITVEPDTVRLAVTAFARPEISEKMEEISAVKVNDLAEIVQEKVLQDTVKVSKDEKKDALVVTGVKSKEEEEIVIFEVVEQMPEYPGGMSALQKYLSEKIAGSPMKGKAGGRVMVGFTVAETGKIKDVRVLQSDEASLNQEAERIVSEMPDWIPGKQRGRPVPVKYTVPIRFGNIRFAENCNIFNFKYSIIFISNDTFSFYITIFKYIHSTFFKIVINHIFLLIS